MIRLAKTGKTAGFQRSKTLDISGKGWIVFSRSDKIGHLSKR
jgi:hypothetical protein